MLKSIANQTPTNVKIITLNLTKNVGKVSVSINAQAQNNNDLSSFIEGLKQEGFNPVSLGNVGLEQGLIRFTINADLTSQNGGGKSL